MVWGKGSEQAPSELEKKMDSLGLRLPLGGVHTVSPKALVNSMLKVPAMQRAIQMCQFGSQTVKKEENWVLDPGHCPTKMEDDHLLCIEILTYDTCLAVCVELAYNMVKKGEEKQSINFQEEGKLRNTNHSYVVNTGN